MSVLQLPACPVSLKSIQHYLKTASEHEMRDPVITYWCRLYSLQTALEIDKKSDEARLLLMALVEWLEKQKKLLAENEAITNDVAAQAHIENYALRLFSWADSQDRAGVFNKNVVKAFYTAGMLMDILTTFGELTDEIASNCKYAKWKAAYIHNCLKNGETPVPGPVGWDNENNQDSDNSNLAGTSGYSQPIGFNIPQGNETQDAPVHPTTPAFPTTPGNSVEHNIPAQPSVSSTKFTPYSPSENNTNVTDLSDPSINSASSGNIKLDPVQITKAQKYCKFASSALNYDDISEAINYLQKALRLLQTGQDS